ncbi:putative transmembrane protein [Toxoplasma gondii RUB]|uniref:Putative transmembrane protein n=1 Tax=Toxoplasma gondii RUB TaxID=935652 RepID=A0A086LZX7_TOXGO|nr:putative transmembrane protein [Toxoplasma gondii RUB]
MPSSDLTCSLRCLLPFSSLFPSLFFASLFFLHCCLFFCRLFLAFLRCVSREPLPFTALFPLGGCVFFLARRLHRPRAFSLALELLRFLSLDFFVSALRLLSAFVFLRRCGGSREKRLCSRISELSRERQQQTAEKDERRYSAHRLPLATSQIRKEREPLRRAVHEQTVNTLTDENKTKERKDRAERKGERRAADPPHSSGALWARRCR